MRHRLFFQIVDQVTVGNPYFQQKVNCAGQIVFSPLHKCTVAMKMLANGCSADSLDDYLRIGESTVLETLKKFVTTIISVFGAEWHRPPSEEEVQRILQHNESCGFLGMLDSIDCMHWEWSNCPTALQGMYKGHKGKPTLILEAVAIEDVSFWHAWVS
jgi:hypothetical protein